MDVDAMGNHHMGLALKVNRLSYAYCCRDFSVFLIGLQLIICDFG